MRGTLQHTEFQFKRNDSMLARTRRVKHTLHRLKKANILKKEPGSIGRHTD